MHIYQLALEESYEQRLEHRYLDTSNSNFVITVSFESNGEQLEKELNDWLHKLIESGRRIEIINNREVIYYECAHSIDQCKGLISNMLKTPNASVNVHAFTQQRSYKL